MKILINILILFLSSSLYAQVDVDYYYSKEYLTPQQLEPDGKEHVYILRMTNVYKDVYNNDSVVINVGIVTNNQTAILFFQNPLNNFNIHDYVQDIKLKDKQTFFIEQFEPIKKTNYSIGLYFR